MARSRRLIPNLDPRPWFFMAMEAAWLIALMDLINLAARGGLGTRPGLLCLLYPAAYLCAGLPGALIPEEAHRSRPKRFALHIALALMGLALALKATLFPELTWNPLAWSLEDLGRPPWTVWLLGPVLGGFIWARGWYLADKRVGLRGLAGAFQAGLVVFLAALPFLSLAGVGAGRFWPLLAAFFIFGLSGLWLAGRSGDGQGRPPKGETTWFILLLLALAAVLGLGLAAWLWVDRELLEFLVSPLVWLWERFKDLLSALARLLPKPEPPPVPEQGMSAPHLANPGFKGPPFDFKWVRRIAEFMFIAGCLAIIGMALFRTLTDLVRWLRKKLLKGSPRAVTKSEYGLWDDLKALFMDLIRWIVRIFRLGRKRTREKTPISPQARTVREIYRRFLAWGRAKGRPKEASDSPYEYNDQIKQILPGREDDLGLLTEAYVLVRYGRVEPGPELIRLVKAAWRRIKSSRPLKPAAKTPSEETPT